jgi:hypothetical protein
MIPYKIISPILFTIFNRPETTHRVFDQIRKIKPKKLYVAADGPRPDHASDIEKCRQTRNIISNIDWSCNVKTDFSSKNLGCRNRMITGINWFFDHEESGIILEDDCFPDPTFFRFCEELLNCYRQEPKVMHISGNNFQKTHSLHSYYFSKYSHIWGWATWRRAWKQFDDQMADLSNFVDSGSLRKLCQNYWEYRYWKIILTQARHKTLSAWSYNWLYTIWKQGGMAITPTINLVKNIGIGKEATNTKSANSFIESVGVHQMIFPLNHPRALAINKLADQSTWSEVYKVPISAIIRNIPLAIRLISSYINGKK